MTFSELVGLFYDALSAHETEEEAYDDVEYVADEAQQLGFSLDERCAAYWEALRG